MANRLPVDAYPRNFILKLYTNCSKCQSKLKKFLLRIPGVHSAKIDEQQCIVSISGTVDPSTAIMLIQKKFRGLKAELLWDDQQTDGNNIQNLAAELAQLEKFAGNEGLESVEIKLNFKGQSGNLINGNRNMEVISQNEMVGNHQHQVLGYPSSPLVMPPSPWSSGYGPSAPPSPWCSGYSPSAPPVWSAYYDGPPPLPPPHHHEKYNSIFNAFSDETAWGRCNIM